MKKEVKQEQPKVSKELKAKYAQPSAPVSLFVKATLKNLDKTSLPKEVVAQIETQFTS